MTLEGFLAGWRDGMRRALVPRAAAAALIAWGLAAASAVVERRAALAGAAERALEGQIFGLIVPIVLLVVSTRVLDRRRLTDATSALARFGLSRRSIALGLVAASMVIGGVASAVVAATTAVLAHDPTAPSLAIDAATCTWIGALTAAAYAALFALGSTFGSRGGGRFWALGFDFLFGGTGGVTALLAPRAHAHNLLGGAPPLLLSQPASTAALAVITATFTTLALVRCSR